MTRGEVVETIWEKLGICGCGDPEAVIDLIKRILECFRDEDHHKIAEILEAKHDGVFWFVLYQLDNAGLIDHGVNVRSGFITDKGKEFLAIISHPNFDLDDASAAEAWTGENVRLFGPDDEFPPGWKDVV